LSLLSLSWRRKGKYGRTVRSSRYLRKPKGNEGKKGECPVLAHHLLSLTRRIDRQNHRRTEKKKGRGYTEMPDEPFGILLWAKGPTKREKRKNMNLSGRQKAPARLREETLKREEEKGRGFTILCPRA